MTFGRRGRQLKRTKGCHEVTQGEKLEGPKPSQNLVFTAIKNKKEYFYKHISSKRRVK